MTKKILITGATGYIGSHLTKKLCDYGCIVTGIDYNLNQNDISKYAEKVIYWDIRENKRITKDNYDCVIHLAARTKVSESVLFPYDFYHTNIIGTQNVIDNLEFDNFIYSSTGAAFQPETSPYAMSKRAGEDLVKLLDKFSICRFYNVSGNNGFNKFDDGHYHLIRKAAAVVNGIYDKIQIFGTDYPTRDGTTIRNYTHVDDITESVKNLVLNGPTNNIECLGNTKGYTVLEVIKMMEKVSKKSINLEMSSRRPGDSIESLLPNQSKYFKELHTLEDQCSSALENELK
jgi:UDP-glucose 4-epimerase